MGSIESVEIVERWVFNDLVSSTFDGSERQRVLNDLEELEDQLVTWDRDLLRCVEIVTTSGDVTVYRRRVGDLRSFFVRRGSTLYCIGVGKRRTVYSRSLDKLDRRAAEMGERR